MAAKSDDDSGDDATDCVERQRGREAEGQRRNAVYAVCSLCVSYIGRLEKGKVGMAAVVGRQEAEKTQAKATASSHCTDS